MKSEWTYNENIMLVSKDEYKEITNVKTEKSKYAYVLQGNSQQYPDEGFHIGLTSEAKYILSSPFYLNIETTEGDICFGIQKLRHFITGYSMMKKKHEGIKNSLHSSIRKHEKTSE